MLVDLNNERRNGTITHLIDIPLFNVKNIVSRNAQSAKVMSGSRGGRGGGGGEGVRTPPLKNHKKYRISSNTGPDSLKNHKAIKPDAMLGQHRHASETPFKWRFASGPMVAHL